MDIGIEKYSIRICLKLILAISVFGCSINNKTGKGLDSEIPSLNGSGVVYRSTFTYEFLNTAKTDTIVDFQHYAVPEQAAFPTNTFEGRLRFGDLGRRGTNKFIIEDSTSAISQDEWADILLFDFEFIQQGSYIIPLKRGFQMNEGTYYEFIVEPGRVWDENGDNGYSRVSIPFALKEKNQNCIYNGAMSFLFKNDGSTSSLVFQTASETCPYRKVNIWGTVKADYTPYPIPEKEQYIEKYIREVKGRIPVKPISELEKDYPGADPIQFSSPTEVNSQDMTIYGFLIDGVHYLSTPETRYGTYPFPESLSIPSYSTAKSIAAGIGLMRMEKLYSGSSSTTIASVVPESVESGNWADVTFVNALDMATGNYLESRDTNDEDIYLETEWEGLNFFLDLDHQSKLSFSINRFPRKSTPGEQFAYHTSDTYLLGTAMNAYLRSIRNSPKADYFRDLVVEDILKPIGTSPGSWEIARTYDSVAQPFSGYGLVFLPDDIVKIGHFLLSGGIINGEQILDTKMLSDVMNASTSSVLSTSWNALKYSKGFWLLDLSEIQSFGNCLVSESELIPYMSGYGGIRVFLLPNGTVYYYFSDNFEYAGLEGVKESNKIRSFCN
ncbi:serine hydrolase domain-containing protein [Algoriphagus pacificus]|nr:hypothetical protein [Algoriphagus pacificus]MBN7817007.1 hypothetical protein [Algoriphagus pacificus]